MFTKMTLAGIERNVPNAQVEHYRQFGWKELGADPVIVETHKFPIVDSGAVKLKAPKKKKVETPAENAKEAVEDLGNANEGE